MTVRLGVEAIKPPQLNISALEYRMGTEMKAVGTEMKGHLNRTTQSWNGPKPTFNVWIKHENGRANLTVYPAGNALGVKKWRYLDEGTQVRRAVMSRDWHSKTRPGLFPSGPGRGKMVFVSKKIRMPGIKARKWSSMLQKHYQQNFPVRIDKAIRAWTIGNIWQI